MPIYGPNEVLSLLAGRKSILNIGPPFSGKTQSLWTLVDYLQQHNLGPLNHFDLDFKADSLIQMLKEKDLLNNYKLIRLASQTKIRSGARKIEDNRKVWEEFQHEFNKFDDQIDGTTGEWKNNFTCGAIIIDSLTKYNEILMNYVAAIVGHDFGEKGTDARNDYTKVMNKIKSTIDTLKSMPCITGWIAHDQITRSEFDGKVVLLPSVTGKDTLAPTLSKEFGYVLYSTTQTDKQGKEEYVWQVRPGGWVRSAGIPSTDPNLPQFIPQDYRRIL